MRSRVQRIMKRLVFVLAAIAIAAPAFACINIYGTDLQGKPAETVFSGKDLVEYLKSL